MKNRTIKGIVSLALMLICMFSISSMVFAETKQFNVTASNSPGVQSPDPYTPRAQKADNDIKFYVTCNYMSGTCNYVLFYMNRYTNVPPISGQYVTYSQPMWYYRSEVGTTKSKTYGSDTYAPAGYYYFMKCVPEYGYNYINVTGQFTP